MVITADELLLIFLLLNNNNNKTKRKLMKVLDIRFLYTHFTLDKKIQSNIIIFHKELKMCFSSF